MVGVRPARQLSLRLIGYILYTVYCSCFIPPNSPGNQGGECYHSGSAFSTTGLLD